MEKTKTCKNCKVSKSIEEFSKGRAVCKPCRSKSYTNKYHKKKALEQKYVQIPKTYFSDRVHALSKYLTENGDDDTEYIGSQLNELNDIFEKITTSNTILYYPIKMSDKLLEYLIQAFKYLEGPNISSAVDVLFYTDPDVFENNFGANMEDLQKEIYDELDDIKFIVDALRHAFKVFVHSYNMTIPKALAHKRLGYMDIDINLDINIPAITISNIFNITNEQLLEKIKELSKGREIWVRNFIQNGYFKKFFDILDDEDDSDET